MELNNKLLVSVPVITYNSSKFVLETLESIKAQTYQNVELIISDDCSTDSTRDILKQYEQNERVKIYYQEKNLGNIKNFEFLF